MRSRALGSVLAMALLGACSSNSDADPPWDQGFSGSGGSDGFAPPGTGETSTGTPIGTTGATTGSAGATIGPSKFDGGGFGTYDKPVVVADPPPPPISGGTLTVIALGHKAAVADSERDQVVVVDLDRIEVATVAHLQKGDEPGRVVEDASARLHVALRGADAVA